MTVGDNFLMGSYMKPRFSALPFKVKACRDAHLAFMIPGIEIVFELMIGASDNTETLLKVKGSRVVWSTETPDILNCEEWRSFWVRIVKQQSLKKFDFGVGSTFGNHRIIHHIERNASDFETIAFASSNGAVAEFEYAESGGRQLFSTTFHCNFVSMNCHL